MTSFTQITLQKISAALPFPVEDLFTRELSQSMVYNEFSISPMLKISLKKRQRKITERYKLSPFSSTNFKTRKHAKI